MRPRLRPSPRLRVRPRRGVWRCWRSITLLLAGALGAAAAHPVEVPWLYEVEVPVADQSTSERIEAGSQALAEVLMRLTGLASVPRNETVTRALAAPDLYFNQFRFEQTDDGDGLELRMQFVPQAVLDLVRDAGLPIWSANRPLVMAWLVVEDGLERRILGADSQHPLVQGLEERARERGLPLRLPLLDLTDQLAVEPAAVWGRLSQVLEPASRRYGAEAVLVGRLRQLGAERYAAEWELWHDDRVVALDREAADPAALGRAAADLAADELAARYAVLDRGVQRLELAVAELRGAQDYAGLLRYLGGLEFVEDVNVASVSADWVHVALLTAARPEQLLELFRLDGRLLHRDLPAPPGGAIELIWQGR